MRREIGKYIFSDPKVGEGELRFKGTRIPVSRVLELIAEGYSLEAAAAAFHHRISKEAVAEAVMLAAKALEKIYEPSGRKHTRARGSKAATL
ncbi:MAG: DUF433 domain-containing protein [Chloroherpetonaceae bacterium]|nr:DUF433 domain-containing protein [Chloroherpetonaceae bacterium]MCS7212209.1 DUF433 domain-containing protein [Chloroherpetonaceae bacterium]MDW8019776.1 DUF433 domain-containing protein [Chloroherpetonaceae bacterium]MDW8465270.1 DUF433 domain-containing protein [Chloroherpetonaceae bacterium]